MPMTLSQLVERVPSNTEVRVKFVKDKFSRLVHSILRRETGLRLSLKDTDEEIGRKRGTTISVRIMPGIPVEMNDFIIPEDQELPLLLSPWRKHLENVVTSGSEILENLLPLLSQDILKGRDNSFPPTIGLAKELLAVAERSRLIELLYNQKNDQNFILDCLGLYRFGEVRDGPNGKIVVDRRPGPVIELYWGVIGLVADDLNVSVEGLALKVLAHEWGHAYTHVGLDIDGKRWETNDFAWSSHALKEGLAQYCALQVAKDIEYPNAIEAYNALVPKQPPAYQTQNRWKGFSPEEIRYALLTERRQGKGTLERFENAMQEVSQQYRGQVGHEELSFPP